MENKFNVGDKVRVKPLSWFKENYSNFKMDGFCVGTSSAFINDEMLKKGGQVIEIKKKHSDRYYHFKCEDGWNWMNEWVEPVFSRKEELKEEIKEKQRELSKIYQEEKNNNPIILEVSETGAFHMEHFNNEKRRFSTPDMNGKQLQKIFQSLSEGDRLEIRKI